MSESYHRHDDFTNTSYQPRGYSDEASYSIVKVFGYMAMFLLITAVVTMGVGVGFNYWMANATSDEEAYRTLMTMIVMLIISGVGLLVLTFVNQFVFLRGKHSVIVPSITYSILMGVVIGFVAAIINDWAIMGLTFAITAGVFGIMALIGLLSKGRLTGLAIIGMGLMFGAMFISVFMLIIMFLFPSIYAWYYWIVSFMMFAGVMFTSIYDISRIKELANQGMLNNNLSMYLAFDLYVDFIYIFLRLLSIVLRIVARMKN